MNENKLDEIIKYQKHAHRFHILQAIENFVVIVSLLVTLFAVVPRLVIVLENADSTLTQVQDLASNANTTITNLTTQATESLNGVNHMVNNADTTITENMDGISEALENINSIDWDTLNGAVGDLQESAENLKKVTSVFNR